MTKLLAYLSIFLFILTMLLCLQPTVQAQKLSDLSGSSSAPARPRATRSAVPDSGLNPCLMNTTRGFRVKYTLVTANSPDCAPSLIDNFPVRVQYRLIHLQPSTEWMDSLCMPSVMPGENFLYNFKANSVSESISKRLYNDSC